MRSRQHRPRTAASVAAALTAAGALALAGAPLASADAIQVVGPHQYFVGDVNGALDAGTVTVGCFGPVTSTSKGYPVAGQWVAVHVPSATAKDAGYTGESAERIVVRFSGAGPSVGLPATIDGYDVRVPIPTTLQLPCSGPGTVAFVPSPTSETARSATVAITYRSSGL
jgi:hypothetical protein